MHGKESAAPALVRGNRKDKQKEPRASGAHRVEKDPWNLDFASAIPTPCKKRKGGAPSVLVVAMESREPQHPDQQQRLARASELVRSHVPPTISLVDELIAERREEARREQP